MEYLSLLKMFIFVMSYPVIKEILGFNHLCFNDTNGQKKKKIIIHDRISRVSPIIWFSYHQRVIDYVSKCLFRPLFLYENY